MVNWTINFLKIKPIKFELEFDSDYGSNLFKGSTKTIILLLNNTKGAFTGNVLCVCDDCTLLWQEIFFFEEEVGKG